MDHFIPWFCDPAHYLHFSTLSHFIFHWILITANYIFPYQFFTSSENSTCTQSTKLREIHKNQGMKWHIGLVCQSFTSRNIGLWKSKGKKMAKRTRSRNLNKENNRDTDRQRGLVKRMKMCEHNWKRKRKSKSWVDKRLRITSNYFLYTPQHVCMCYSTH